MLCQSCGPYRTLSGVWHSSRARVHVVRGGGAAVYRLLYTVSWTVQREDGLLQDTVGSFTEPSHFTSAGEALDFGKARAHTFIDDICFEGRPLALPHLSVSILALYVPIFGPAEKASR
jgi:hypothetical protein